MTSSGQADDRVVAALYRFVTLEDFVELREPLLEVCLDAEAHPGSASSGVHLSTRVRRVWHGRGKRVTERRYT